MQQLTVLAREDLSNMIMSRQNMMYTRKSGEFLTSFSVRPYPGWSLGKYLGSRFVRCLSSLALVALAAGCGEEIEPPAAKSPSTPARETADLVLRDGYVYTVDGSKSVAKAIAILGSRILAVGTNGEIDALVGPDTVVRDLGGQMVIPGIQDTHMHAMAVVEPEMCDFKGEAKSLEEMVPFLKDCLARYAPEPGQWMIALQWPFSRGNQPSQRYTTLRAALDAVSTVHPIMLAGDDGHHGAANSVALAQAKDSSGNVVGMSRDTLASIFSEWREHVAVDSTGEPSGGLNEGARMLVRPDLFEQILGTGEAAETTMPRVARLLASRGITSIHDPLVVPDSLASYKWLEDSGGMTFRMRASLYERPVDSMNEAAAAQIPTMISKFGKLREQYKNSKLMRVDGVKLFADSVLEGNPFTAPPTLPSAAVLNGFRQPLFEFDESIQSLEITGYVNPDSPVCESVRANPGDYAGTSAITVFQTKNGFLPAQCTQSQGVLEHSEKFIHEYVRLATEAGFNVHVHALSDKGVRVAIDALEQAKTASDREGLTQSLAHLQLVHPDEQTRIGALGAYATFTYSWIVPEPNYNLMVIPFIEQVKSKDTMFDASTYYMQNVYPVKTIADAGGILTWGSDVPVDSRDPRPFLHLEQAVTRAWEGAVLNPLNLIDIHAALAAFTINGARMLGIGEQTGSIEPGKFADVVVLDQNVVQLAARGEVERISGTQVLLTVFDGRIVYEKPAD